MGRFNTRSNTTSTTTSPIKSEVTASSRTGNNAPGFVRDAKSELFLLGVSNFVGQDAFYEKGNKRDERFVGLVRQVALEDPEWLSRFLLWLRGEANMRTAALIGAVEFAIARLKVPDRIMVRNGSEADAGVPPRGITRATIDWVCQRADEPGEILGYYMSTYGRKLPKPVKRGVADAAARLFNERNTLKYDTASHPIRFGDVLELCHVKPVKPYQTTLFKHLIDRRHNRDGGIPEALTMLGRNALMRSDVARHKDDFLNPQILQYAGFTWEDVLSLLGSRVEKKRLWEALIPSMGYMALLRNLRNFDEAGVSDEVAQKVIKHLTDRHEIARSRQLPMRFLSAYRAVPSLRWSYPLEQALEGSLRNVPQFDGRTLILIDTSGSMNSSFSKDGSLRFWDAAAMFGLALARRCEHADVVSFSSSTKVFPLSPGESLLRSVERFRNGWFFGGDTETDAALRTHYHQHDRVVLLTDEQADYHGYRAIGSNVPHDRLMVTFNLAGYREGHAPSGTGHRVTIGGLTDQAFKLLPILEQRANGQWPF